MSEYEFSIEELDGCQVAVLRTKEYMFTTDDWQGQQPQSIDEARHYDWVAVDPANPTETTQWVPTIIMDGMPHILLLFP